MAPLGKIWVIKTPKSPPPHFSRKPHFFGRKIEISGDQSGQPRLQSSHPLHGLCSTRRREYFYDEFIRWTWCTRWTCRWTCSTTSAHTRPSSCGTPCTDAPSIYVQYRWCRHIF
ncbi:hypothetical protein ACS0TY_008281 [Phlomoides rotata]